MNDFQSRYLTDFEQPVDCLREGRYGVVFKAKNKIDGCNYAIKRIALPDSQASRECVMEEVKTLAKLDHHNIVKYHCSWLECPPPGWQKEYNQQWINKKSVFTNLKKLISSKSFTENYAAKYKLLKNEELSDVNYTNHLAKITRFLYIQMQLCKADLREWLDQHHTSERDLIRAFNIFQQIIDAVEYIHSQGLIHRDLKPSNIFFAYDNKIKIGDFGLVTSMTKGYEICTSNRKKNTNFEDTSVHIARVGTNLYMSPEQENGQMYNYKVDIYSLGIIFFELFTPFPTYMKRIEVLTNLKMLIFPKSFTENYAAEYKLLKMMLDNDPAKRPTILGIKSRLPFQIHEIANAINIDKDSKWHFRLSQVTRHSPVASSNTSLQYNLLKMMLDDPVELLTTLNIKSKLFFIHKLPNIDKDSKWHFKLSQLINRYSSVASSNTFLQYNFFKIMLDNDPVKLFTTLNIKSKLLLTLKLSKIEKDLKLHFKLPQLTRHSSAASSNIFLQYNLLKIKLDNAKRRALNIKSGLCFLIYEIVKEVNVDKDSKWQFELPQLTRLFSVVNNINYCRVFVFSLFCHLFFVIFQTKIL